MKYLAKDVLEQTIMLLDLQPHCAAEDSACHESGATHEAELKEERSLLLKLLNMVCVSLATRVPLLIAEDITTDVLGDILYSRLRSNVSKVVSLTQHGAKVEGERLSDRIVTGQKNTLMRIVYAIVPLSVTEKSTLPFSTTDIPQAAIAYALAAEYQLVMGNFDASRVFSDRAEQALKPYLPCASFRKIPARTFI